MKTEYLMFRELEYKGKTKKFAVVSKNNQDDILGIIEYRSKGGSYANI